MRNTEIAKRVTILLFYQLNILAFGAQGTRLTLMGECLKMFFTIFFYFVLIHYTFLTLFFLSLLAGGSLCLKNFTNTILENIFKFNLIT